MPTSLVTAAAAAALLAAPLPDRADGPRRFVWGVYTQSVATHRAWARRGINTLMTHDAAFPGYGYTAADYNSSAKANRLQQIRGPGSGADKTAARDCGDPSIAAWNLQDEPDGAGKQTPAELAATIASWRAVCPAKPVMINFVSIGPAYQVEKAPGTGVPYLDYLALPVDWIGGDIYPEQTQTQGKPPLLLLSGWNMGALRPFLTTSVGAATDTLFTGPYRGQRPGSAGKPVFQFLATGRVDLGNPNPKPPSPRRFRLLAWSAIVNGASGLILFPQVAGSLSVTASATKGILTVEAAGWRDYAANPDKIHAGLKLACDACEDLSIAAQTGGTPGGVGIYTLSARRSFASRAVTLLSPVGTSGDDSDPGVLSELTALIANTKVMENAGLLMDPARGGRAPFRVWHSADLPADPNAVPAALPAGPGDPTHLPRGFEGATFARDGRTWFLVLNLCDCNRVLSYAQAPWRVENLRFARYEARLFSSDDAANRFVKAGVED